MKTNIPLPSHESNTPRIVALLLLAACLLIMLTGCKPRVSASNAPTGPATVATGVYTLVSVDGKMLPCALNHEGTAMTLQSGDFTIGADGHCSTSTTVSIGANKPTSIIRRASYEQSGNQLTMKWEGFGMTKGALSGDDFTMNNEGMIFVYRKSPR